MIRRSYQWHWWRWPLCLGSVMMRHLKGKSQLQIHPQWTKFFFFFFFIYFIFFLPHFLSCVYCCTKLHIPIVGSDVLIPELMGRTMECVAPHTEQSFGVSTAKTVCLLYWIWCFSRFQLSFHLSFCRMLGTVGHLAQFLWQTLLVELYIHCVLPLIMVLCRIGELIFCIFFYNFLLLVI